MKSNRNKSKIPIDPEKCQVFLMHCPVTLPLQFASHPWFVCNDRGAVSRWEVLDRKNEHNESWGYIHRDYFPIESGIEIVPLMRKEPLWKGELLVTIEGNQAKRMIDLLKKSPNQYPYGPWSSSGNWSTFCNLVSWRQTMSYSPLPIHSENPLRPAARSPFTFHETMLISRCFISIPW